MIILVDDFVPAEMKRFNESSHGAEGGIRISLITEGGASGASRDWRELFEVAGVRGEKRLRELRGWEIEDSRDDKDTRTG